MNILFAVAKLQCFRTHTPDSIIETREITLEAQYPLEEPRMKDPFSYQVRITITTNDPDALGLYKLGAEVVVDIAL